MTTYLETELYIVVESSEVDAPENYAIINKGNKLVEGTLTNLPNAIEAALILQEKFDSLQKFIEDERKAKEEAAKSDGSPSKIVQLTPTRH